MCWSWPFAFMSPCPNITLPGDFSSVRVDRAIDRSPIRFRLPGPPSALWRRGFFHGAIMPSVANLPATVFDVRYAPNSGQIVAVPRLSALCHKRTHAPQQIASQFDRAYPVDTHIYRTRRHPRMKGLMTMKTLATILAAAFLATISLPALLGVEAAWAGSLSSGKMPGQSQRSIDSG